MGTDVSGTSVIKQRTHRQYMNRRKQLEAAALKQSQTGAQEPAYRVILP